MSRLPSLLLLVAGVATAAPLRYAEDSAPGTLNPLFTTNMTEARMQELLFDGLFTDDRALRATPELVASYRIAEDRRSMTLDLRNNVRWHDGTALSADDVVFTIRAMKDPATASTESARVAFIEAVEKVGERSVRIRFKGPELSPEDKLNFKILPAHRFTGLPVTRADPFRGSPIGTGPFLLSEFAADGSVVLQRNTEYFEEVDLNGATLREVADRSYQAKLLVYQSLEALVRVVPRDLATLESDRGIELYPYQTNSWWYIGMNQDSARWSDPEWRAALALMIDEDELLRPIGTGDTVTGPFVRSSPFYNHEVRKVANDPDTSRTTFATKGYEFNGSVWEKDGQPLVFRILVQQDDQVGQDVAGAHRGQLVGVAHQQQTRTVGGGIQQRRQQLDIQHRRLVDDQQLDLQRVVAIASETSSLGTHLQKPMNGGCRRARGLLHSLRRAASWRSLDHQRAFGGETAHQRAQQGGLTGARSSGEDCHLGACQCRVGGTLLVGERWPAAVGDGPASRQLHRRGRQTQGRQSRAGGGFGDVQPRQVDAVVGSASTAGIAGTTHHLATGQQLVERRADPLVGHL